MLQPFCGQSHWQTDLAVLDFDRMGSVFSSGLLRLKA
jgi:hypothetical protein